MPNIFKVKTAGDEGFRLVEASSKTAALLRVSAEYFSAEPVSKNDLIDALDKGVQVERLPAATAPVAGNAQPDPAGGSQ